jgi:glycosyltransferase involved in cell wall biosynthesis
LTNEFFSIDNLILEELLAEYAMGQSLKSSARKILESAEFNKVRFVKDDLFFCIGALWGVEYSYDAIRGLIKKGVKFIPFIYDLIPILESELHTSDEGMVVAFLRYMNFSIQNAPFICHLSKHTQKDFDAFTQKNFGTKMPGKVFGAIPKILGSSDNPSEKILELHNRNYILQVGTIEPRKCHTLTLKTFTSLVNTDPKFDLDLVFVGRKGWKMDSEWQVFEDSFQSGRVHHLTEISDDQLQTLYSEARFSVFPSRSEGWGLPISESLLFGTPCLVRNSGAMTEAGGEYATYFNDESEFERLFSLLCLDDNFLASETRKADKFTLSNQKSPLSHLLDIVKMPLGSSFSPRFLIEMGREYSFRNTSLSLNAARNQKLVTPFFSKTPTLKSFLESQTMLVNHLSDQFEACWMTKTSELSFAVPKDAKIFVMLSVFAESSGYLRISWMGDFCERYVEAGVNLVSFQISVGTSGLVTLKFLNRNLKTDSRNLEVAIDSMLVTKHDDYPTRELALHNWVNVGKEHAKTYRS